MKGEGIRGSRGGIFSIEMLVRTVFSYMDVDWRFPEGKEDVC